MEDPLQERCTIDDLSETQHGKRYTKCGEIMRHNETHELSYMCWLCLEMIQIDGPKMKEHILQHFDGENESEFDIESNGAATIGMKIECPDESGDDDYDTDNVDASYFSTDDAHHSAADDKLTDQSHVFELTVDDIDLDESDDEENFTVTCQCCASAKYPCKGILKEHLIEQKQSIPVFRCDDCNGIFTSTHELRMHMDTHELPEESIVECRYCATVFSSESELRSHRTEGANRIGPKRKMDSPIHRDVDVQEQDDEAGAGASGIQSPYLVTSMLIEKPAAGEGYDSNESASDSNDDNDTANDMMDADESSQQSHDQAGASVLVQCDRCSKIFRYPETNLHEHQKLCMKSKVVDGDIGASGVLQCSVCAIEFQRNANYIDHVLSAHNGISSMDEFTCAICGNVWPDFDDLIAHIRAEHAESAETEDDPAHKSHKMRQFQCHLCDQTFGRRSQYQEHFKRAHKNASPGNFECSVCKKIFKNRDNLLQHQRIHSGERPYECSICHKRFNHSSYINIHMRTHTKERPFACNICDKDFISRSKLTAHMKAHNDIRPHKCSDCDRSFRTPADMRNHYRAEHTNERPFECMICGNDFAKQKLLNQHLFLHQMKKHFKCRYCPLEFSQPAGRHGHEKRIHRV